MNRRIESVPRKWRAMGEAHRPFTPRLATMLILVGDRPAVRAADVSEAIKPREHLSQPLEVPTQQQFPPETRIFWSSPDGPERGESASADKYEGRTIVAKPY